MGDTIQKLGFDASAALANLQKFRKSVDVTAKSMLKFVTSGKKVNNQPFDESLKRFIPTAKSVQLAWDKIGAAAQQSGKKQTQAGKAGKRAADGLTLSWQTLGRIVQTQVLLRGFRVLAAAFEEATEKARDFGLAVEEIQTISNSALGSSSVLSNTITEMGNELGVTSDQIAEGAYQILSNQIGAASDSMGVLITAQKLATITGSETAAAVNAISSVLNSYGLATSEATRVSDILFKTVELGRLRLEDIANVLGRVTPLTAALGISFEETAAAIAVMTRQGVKADTAVTQLRAITQKLIKPTEKMQELFRKWGVESGPQAIKTFGGLEGVLSKLAKETDNNSTEMATYFNRVRAIVGQMSAMTDRGKLLRDTQNEITESVNATGIAWEKFTQSDAFQLQKAQAAFNNELTKSGSVVLSFATGWNIVKTEILSGLTEIFDGVSSGFAEYEQRLSDISRKTSEKAEEAAKGVNQVTQEQLNDLLKFERLHLAEVGKIWFAANDSIEADTRIMIDGIKGALDDMLSGFKDKFKPITDFVKKQRGGKGDNTLKADNKTAQKKLDDVKQSKEDNNRTDFQNVDDRITRSQKASAKARAQFSKAFTDEQEATARATQTTAEEQAKNAVSLAKGTKNAVKMREAAENYERTIKSGITSRNAALANRARILPISEKIQQSVEAQVKSRKEINNQIVKELKTLSKADTAEGEVGAQDRLKELFNRLKEFSIPDKSLEVFKAFGVEELPQELQDQLESQVYSIEAEVKLNFEGIQTELNKINKEMQTRLDPTGSKGAAAKDVLGRGQGKGEGFNQFLAKGLEEAEINAKKFSKTNADVLGQLSREESAQEAVNETQVQFNDLLGQKQAALKSLNSVNSQAFGGGADSGLAALAGGTQGQVTIQEFAGEMLKLRDIYGQYNTQLESGKPLSADQLETLKQTAEAARTSSSATIQDTKLIADSISTLVNRNNEMKKGNELRAQQSKNKPQEQATNKLLDLAAEDTERTKDALGIMETQSAAIAKNIQDFATAASNALGNTGSLVTGWGAVKAAVEAAAKAAVAAYEKVREAAAAAAAAPSASFRGGYQTFAHGGAPTQGQDTIPALLSPGEFVVNSASAGKFFSELNSINSGAKPAFREQGGSVTNVGDVNVTVNGGDSSQQTVREIGNALRREIKRGTIKLN